MMCTFLFTRLLTSNIMALHLLVSWSNSIYSNLRPFLRPHFTSWIVLDLPCLSKRVGILHQRGNELKETLCLFLQRVKLDKGFRMSRLTTCRDCHSLIQMLKKFLTIFLRLLKRLRGKGELSLLISTLMYSRPLCI